MITKRNESTRNVTKRKLGKTPYLGDSKGIIGSIIDFHESRGIAGESGNRTQRNGFTDKKSFHLVKRLGCVRIRYIFRFSS